MWTVVRFELNDLEDYATAFGMLARAGFAPHRRPGSAGPGPLPAAVVRDLFQDPAVVTRAVFDALDAAGLSPVGVSAAHVDVGGRRPRRAALAPG